MLIFQRERTRAERVICRFGSDDEAQNKVKEITWHGEPVLLTVAQTQASNHPDAA